MADGRTLNQVNCEYQNDLSMARPAHSDSGCKRSMKPGEVDAGLRVMRMRRFKLAANISQF